MLYRFYIIMNSVMAMVIFLYGFLPMNYNTLPPATLNSIPQFIRENNYVSFSRALGVASNGRVNLKAFVDFTVIVVVDALRYDFVQSANGSYPYMPLLGKMMKKSRDNACLYRCKTNLPTVTMPRIKAMMSGSVPSFVDVILNFGASELKSDNLLIQAKRANKRIVFYGDKTWTDLFRNVFYRQLSVTSFFVNDFYDVDENVTEKVSDELKRWPPFWDMMILHYLGLDHIGHVQGPKGELIPNKLIEMDRIVRKIYNYLENMRSKLNKRYLLIITSDHGMADGGGHGGSSEAEIFVPFVAVGLPCSSEFSPFSDYQKKNYDGSIAYTTDFIHQVDIAPTLSVLMGLPIPSGNVGKLIPGLLEKSLSREYLLIMYYYNMRQVLGTKSDIWKNHPDLYNTHKMAKEMHTNIFWNGLIKKDILTARLLNLYKYIMDELSSYFIENAASFNMASIYMATIIQIQCVFLSMSSMTSSDGMEVSVITIIVIVGLLWKSVQPDYGDIEFYLPNILNKILRTFYYDALIDNVSFVLFMQCVLFGLLFYNFIILIRLWCKLKHAYCDISYLFKMDVSFALLMTATSAQIVATTFSTSFIELENYVWHFLWYSVLLWRMATMKKKPDNVWFYVDFVVARLFCKIHPETFNTSELFNNMIERMTTREDAPFFIFFLLYGICRYFILGIRGDSSWYSKGIYAMCWILVILCKAAVEPLVWFGSKNGIWEWMMLKAALLLYVGSEGFSRVYNSRNPKIPSSMPFYYLNLAKELNAVVWNVWIVIACALGSIKNIFLAYRLKMGVQMGMMLLKRTGYSDSHNSIANIFLVSRFLAHTFYHYHGNTNKLSTIDVSAGYLGQKDYTPYTTGQMIVANLYSMPTLTYVLTIFEIIGTWMSPTYYVEPQAGRNRSDIRRKRFVANEVNSKFNYRKNFDEGVRIVMFFLNLEVALFMITITIQRYHLFVWSVFCPKMLYLFAFSTHHYFFMLFMIFAGVWSINSDDREDLHCENCG